MRSHVQRICTGFGALSTLYVLIACSCLLPLIGCHPNERSVVVYVSVDQVYAEPILKAFEKTSGIKVRALYDVEAAKTTGLATRLVSEKSQPRADVFWSGEFAQTIRLKEQGVLAPMDTSSADQLPGAFKDPDKQWFGIGGRARVFLVNKNLLKPEDYPKRLEDLLDAKYPADRIGLALPLFGTSATHAAALYDVMGESEARGFYTDLKTRGVGIVDGNAVVRDMVASEQWMFGLTDTDDALGAIARGASVDVVAPDQAGRGTLIIPGTVALVRGAPHSKEASQLINYLLRPETEKDLMRAGFCQWSLRGDLKASPMFPDGLRVMQVSLENVNRQLPKTMAQMREIFSR